MCRYGALKRTMKKLQIIIILLTLCIQVNAQTDLPQKIRISTGRCNSTCGYALGFNNIRFEQELEYTLSDSTFRYRRIPNKDFKNLEVNPSVFFTDSNTYIFLDSLFQTFTDFKSSPGKYFIYRIELIYCTSKTGLPAKIKTMDFLITTNPEKTHPELIETLIEEYQRIKNNAP